tara:strand:- start:99 stop:377 length:279 start_codon:yes stop_codon:yes gene_type:complete
MKKILLIFILSIFLSTTSNAGMLCRTVGIGCPTMSGCVYDEFGRKVECVSIKFHGKTGITHSQATSMCLSAVNRIASERGFTHSAATGGCVY